MDTRPIHQLVRRPESGHDDLAGRIAHAVPEDGTARPLDGLMLRRASTPTEMGHGTSYPSLCVIAQGSKEIRVGNRRHRYDPAHYLIVSSTLPIATRVLEASVERPFLGFVLSLDPALVGSVMVEAGRPEPRSDFTVTAIDVSPLDSDLLDAVVRLVRLLDTPADAAVLGPLIKWEIVYRLLSGGQGDRIAQRGRRNRRPGPAPDRSQRPGHQFPVRAQRVRPRADGHLPPGIGQRWAATPAHRIPARSRRWASRRRTDRSRPGLTPVHKPIASGYNMLRDSDKRGAIQRVRSRSRQAMIVCPGLRWVQID